MRTKGNLGDGWHLTNGWRIGSTMPEGKKKHGRKLSHLEKTTCAKLQRHGSTGHVVRVENHGGLHVPEGTVQRGRR